MTKGEPLYYFFNPTEGLRIRQVSLEQLLYQYFSHVKSEPVMEARIQEGQFKTHRQELWDICDFEPEFDAYFRLRYGPLRKTTYTGEIG